MAFDSDAGVTANVSSFTDSQRVLQAYSSGGTRAGTAVISQLNGTTCCGAASAGS